MEKTTNCIYFSKWNNKTHKILVWRPLPQNNENNLQEKRERYPINKKQRSNQQKVSLYTTVLTYKDCSEA